MVAFQFEEKNWDERKTVQIQETKTLGDLRFRQLFKDRDWQDLPPAVRQRFGRRVAIGQAIVYRGEVEFNRVNRWGRILNMALRLIGAPLPLDTQNTGAVAVVTVTEAPDGSQIWMRQYGRGDDKRPFPQIIQSAKKFTGATGVEEHIGRGIGMSLLPCVENHELVFRAQDIFWDIGPKAKKLRLTLPRWLGPNVLRAGHEETGPGRFAFTLRLEHRWFGKLVDQRVAFREDEAPPVQDQEPRQ